MKTEKELTDKIMKITMVISEKYPELAKFIVEMPVTVPDETDPAINIKNLKDYYHSLENLLKKYEVHQNIITK